MEGTVTISLAEYEKLKMWEDVVKKKHIVISFGYGTTLYAIKEKENENEYLLRELISTVKKKDELSKELHEIKFNKRKWYHENRRFV